MDRPSSATASPGVARRQMHLRQVESCAFQRDDGLWDLEITLMDRKPFTFPGGSRDHPAGTPIHHLGLRVTVDTKGRVLQAGAVMRAVPYEETCPGVAAAYGQLVGLELFEGFRAEVKRRLAGRAGCSHLSELAAMLPTLAVQAFAGVVEPVRDDGSHGERPKYLDRCHGLSVEGEAVRRYFPRWYVKPS